MLRVLGVIVLVAAASTWPARVRAAADMPRVRSSSAFIRQMIDDAIEASPTFRKLVGAIGATDGIIYIEEGVCYHGVRACLSLDVTKAAGFRFLRVLIDLPGAVSRNARLDLMATLGHELWHALEVLTERGLATSAAIFQFYAREAPTSNLSFETQAAISVGARVRREASRESTLVRHGWRNQCAGPDTSFGSEGWWAWPCI
jgi:hypothetical protein